MKRLMVTMVMLIVLSNQALARPHRDRSDYRGFGGVSVRSYSYDYYNGRDGYSNYYGHPNTNVQVKYKERWDVQGGERSYEQSPSLPGKVIDAATVIGALLIICR